MPKRKPAKAKPRKVKPSGASNTPERQGVRVVWRGASGKFVKRPKGMDTAMMPDKEKEARGIYSQVIGRRTLTRDPSTGRFVKADRPPEEVVIGKGKRAKVLRPTTESKRVRPLKYDEADVMMESASTVSRHIEDNAMRGVDTYYKFHGVYHKVKPGSMGAFAQYIRLLAARYYAHMRPVLNSPWLQIGLVELSDADLFDLDDISLAADGMIDALAGVTEADEAGAAFLEDMEGLTSNYLTDGKKTDQDKPTAKGRGKAYSKDPRKGGRRRN